MQNPLSPVFVGTPGPGVGAELQMIRVVHECLDRDTYLAVFLSNYLSVAPTKTLHPHTGYCAV
eukprot:197-Pelagomonas_calceolata.AAC.1